MSKSSTPILNKVLISLNWESNIYHYNQKWKSYVAYYFFFFFFNVFYRKLFFYNMNLWRYEMFSVYFSEKWVLNYFYNLNYPAVLHNYSLVLTFSSLDESTRNRFYSPGTIYIYLYNSEYYLISIYLFGSLKFYKFLTQLNVLTKKKKKSFSDVASLGFHRSNFDNTFY